MYIQHRHTTLLLEEQTGKLHYATMPMQYKHKSLVLVDVNRSRVSTLSLQEQMGKLHYENMLVQSQISSLDVNLSSVSSYRRYHSERSAYIQHSHTTL